MNTKINNTPKINKCVEYNKNTASAQELAKKFGIKPISEFEKRRNLFIASLRFGRK